MGIGLSIFLIAVGAILFFAVERTAEGIDLDAVGVILMVVGGLGLLVSLLVGSRLSSRTDRTVVRDDRTL